MELRRTQAHLPEAEGWMFTPMGELLPGEMWASAIYVRLQQFCLLCVDDFTRTIFLEYPMSESQWPSPELSSIFFP